MARYKQNVKFEHFKITSKTMVSHFFVFTDGVSFFHSRSYQRLERQRVHAEVAKGLYDVEESDRRQLAEFRKRYRNNERQLSNSGGIYIQIIDI